MRLKASVLVCVLAVAMCFLLSGVVHSTPCERTDPQEWEPSDSDPRSYAATVERFQSELEAYGYASVFRQLQSDLEIWIYENGTDDPHTHLLEAFRTLNTRFADYERRLAELVSEGDEDLDAAAGQFLDEHATGLFQRMDTPCGWFSGTHNVRCGTIRQAVDCAQAEDFLYRTDTVERLIGDFRSAALAETVRGIRLAAARWERFLDDGKTMYPWEAGLNALLVKSGSVQEPPMHQWVFLHPQVCASLSTSSLSDLTARDAFCVEALGHLWYTWRDEACPERGMRWWGICALAVFRDDMRPGAGLALEFGKTMTLGVVWHDDDEDDDWFDNDPYFVMSVDLLSFARQEVSRYASLRDEARGRLDALTGR